MIFVLNDYFKVRFPRNHFDGIITDIPYKNAINKKLNEKMFNPKKFLLKTDIETNENSFLITFVNFRNAVDLILLSRRYSRWIYHIYQIWDKQPLRNWISWSYPLRHVEFILYFVKGLFKYDFRNGIIRKPYNRKNFGGKLKNIKSKKLEKSFGMYSEILNIKLKEKRIHPTQKPTEFSKIFAKIVGKEKKVLDPFVGSGALLSHFPDSIGVDIKNYGNFTNQNKEFLKSLELYNSVKTTLDYYFN